MPHVIFFKKRGSKDGDVFRGTFAGPDDSPSEWDYLIKDCGWPSNLKFKVWEYSDPTELPIAKSYLKRDITIAIKGSNMIVYGTSASLTSTAIKAWILKNVSTEDEITEENETSTEITPTARETPEVAKISDSSENSEDIVVNKSNRNNVLFFAGGGMIITAMALAGAVIGNILAYEEDDIFHGNDFLIKEDGSKPDFSDVDWDNEIYVQESSSGTIQDSDTEDVYF